MTPPRHRGPRRARAGLTFVELLMAATLFAILTAGVSLHLRAGLVAWRRATTKTEALQAARITWDRMDTDLRSACTFSTTTQPSLMPQNVFGSDSLAFCTRRSTLPDDAVPSRTAFVTYHVTDHHFVVVTQTLREARADPGTYPGTSTVLLEAIDGLSVEYGIWLEGDGSGQIEWTSTWKPEDGIPRLVRVTLTPPATVGTPPALSHIFVLPVGIIKGPVT